LPVERSSFNKGEAAPALRAERHRRADVAQARKVAGARVREVLAPLPERRFKNLVIPPSLFDAEVTVNAKAFEGYDAYVAGVDRSKNRFLAVVS